MDNELIELTENLGQSLQAQGLKLAVAESCTGGRICQLLTEIAGSSLWFDRGFICYSNNSKIQMLAVNKETIIRYGAVSKQTALEMAQGALNHSEADCAIAVTGIAGPGGGSLEKPVGTVFVALQNGKQSICYENHFNGMRHEVRLQTASIALNAMLKMISN
jgi:nicotinamide-nucleotide amidase